MKLYPAIDVLGGRAVRLRQGRREDLTDYGTPLEMAIRWSTLGADWVHVVDLDGAFGGRRIDGDLIGEMRRACPRLRIQTGGGIRNQETAEALLEQGAVRIVLGTAAIGDPSLARDLVRRFPGRIAVGIDARDGVARLEGWTKGSDLTAVEIAHRMEAAGVELIVYTDVSRDGEFAGVNVNATVQILEATELQVIASGGVAGVEDIRCLWDLGHPRLDGVIIGKALYEGRLDLKDAFAVTRAG